MRIEAITNLAKTFKPHSSHFFASLILNMILENH